MYRFKTKEEFIKDGLWISDYHLPEKGFPEKWNDEGEMNKYLGQEIPKNYNSTLKMNKPIRMDSWSFSVDDYVLIEKPVIEELTTEELVNKFKSLIT